MTWYEVVFWVFELKLIQREEKITHKTKNLIPGKYIYHLRNIIYPPVWFRQINVVFEKCRAGEKYLVAYNTYNAPDS